MPLSPPRTCSATSGSIARTRAGCGASPNKLLAPVAPITRQLWLGGGSSGMAFDAYLPAGVRRIVGRDFPQDNTRWREKMKTRPVISNRHDGPVSAQFLSSRRSVAPQLFSRGASKVAAQTSDMIGMDASPVVDHTSRDEETMQNLIVVGFKGKHRASEVLGQ